MYTNGGHQRQDEPAGLSSIPCLASHILTSSRPRWNVVENYDSVEIQNHLKTFNAFQLDHHIELDQTIIRIPLRTAAQAKQSKLFQTKVEISDIIQALKEFGQEIKEGGLLFLKHIRRITIRINSETLFDAEILETDRNDVK